MKEEKQKVCRVCLSSTKRKYVSLFEKHESFYIFDQINSISNVQITTSDGLPDKICRGCLADLDTAINFRHKCEESNLILRNSSPHPKGKTEEFHEIVVKKEEPGDLEQADEVFDFETLQFINTEESVDNDLNYEDKAQKHSVENIPENIPVLKPNEQFQCDDCKALFKSKCKLRVHWKKSHMISKLLCCQCKRRFKSFVAYNRHMQKKPKSCLAAKDFRIEGEGKGRLFYCKECEYKSVRIKDIMTHWVTHTGDRPFKCDLCAQTFTQQSSLMAHKETAHQKYKCELTCQYCGKLVKGRNKIYRHLKLHTEARVHCDICGKSFKNKTSLTQHKQRHSGTKSYTCEKCARSFYTYAELSNHKRTIHSQIKVWYKCDLCEYTSTRKETIKKHKAKHTDTNISCTVCGMFVENSQKLILHQRRHFEEKQYSCPFCELKFFRRDTVPKHIKAKHAAPYHVNLVANQQPVVQNLNSFIKEENLDHNVSSKIIKPESPIHIND